MLQAEPERNGYVGAKTPIEQSNNDPWQGLQLNFESITDLQKSGISPSTVAGHNVHTVPLDHIFQHLGYRLQGLTSILCFPYPGVPGFCRDKLFPAHLKDRSGHKIRYLQRPGTGCRLYIPNLAATVLKDVATPLRITEGEKKALKACQEGYPCIGLGGLWNFLKDGKLIEDFERINLKKREAILVPDAEVWMDRQDLLLPVYKLGKLLEERGARVFVEVLPSILGQDKLDDFLTSAGESASVALHELSKVPLDDDLFSVAARREPPRPLRRSIPHAGPYPLAALGMLAEPVQVLADTIQAPLALCGQSILAAATLAVQAHRDIILDGRIIPLSENYLTIGESGERKSAVDREVLRAHRAYEKRQYDDYEAKKLDYANDLAAYQKARDEALKKAKTRTEKKKALDALGSPPIPPLDPLFITEEPTYEGLVKLLQHGLPTVGLFADEGGRMIGGYGMSETQELKTACGLSELWDGKRISRVRGGDGATLLYGRRVSMHLMAQPQVAQKLLSNPLLMDQGLLSRCLTIWPTSTAGTRKYNDVDLRQNAALSAYERRITDILEAPLPLAKDKANELDPPQLPLSPEAKALWIKFHDQIEEQLADSQPLAPIRGLANKIPEHALRLAGVLTLYDDISAVEIPLAHMGNGIKLAQYYAEEALRLFQSGAVDPDLVLAEKLLAWGHERGTQYLSLVDIYQKGPNPIRDTKTAKKITAILEDHGWFIPVPNGMELDGHFRREVWEVYREREI